MSRSVHRAMVETINVPEADEFQIITENSAAELVYHPTFLGIQRTDDIVIVQIYLGVGRTIEQKQTLYARMVEVLKDDPGIAPADVFINLVETPIENWSLGNGLTTFVR
nr:tautomerase family protein [Streptomyces phyllanthi]